MKGGEGCGGSREREGNKMRDWRIVRTGSDVKGIYMRRKEGKTQN